MIREEWLNLAGKELRTKVFEKKDIKWNESCSIKISCGWPTSKALSRDNRTLGQCHKSDQSEGYHNEIFVSPCLSEADKVLEVMVHEIIHALDDCESKHSGFFAKTAKKVGLEGRATHTHAGEELSVCLNAITSELGPYPHSKLEPKPREKKQTTRLIKAMCPCGYIIRTTKQWIEKGLPTCPCGQKFILENKGDGEDAESV